MTKPYNAKHKLVKSGKRGEDSRVDEILSNPESDLAKNYAICEEFLSNKLKRGYIEACLFCSDDVEKISDILEIPQALIEIYQEFFFDVRGWDRLSKLEHTDSIPVTRHQEMMLKMWALNHGLEFISWRLGKSITISPVQGLQDLFNICIYKSKEAMYNNSTSEASKESTRWVKLSTDISRLLKLWVMDSSAAKKDLELAIKEVVPDFAGIDSILDDIDGTPLDDMEFGGIDDVLEKKSDD